MYYSEQGELLKKFNTRDGMAIELLREKNIPVIFITREKSKHVIQRAKKLSVPEVFVGIKNKITLLSKICQKYNVKKNEIAYIGDDLNDLQIINSIGFSATPSDGNYMIKKNVDYTCEIAGGMGAFREFADLIVKKKMD